MKPLVIAAGVLCAALISLGVFLAVNESKGGPRLMALDPLYTKRVEQGYWTKGNEEASVTLLEYGDFQCPACKAEYPIVEGALAQMGDQVEFQYRNFPLPQHTNAELASIGAEAAGRQGKFWEMYSKLFLNQDSWTNQSKGTFEATLKGYAKDLNLNVEQFNRDLDDDSVLDEIDKDQAAGNKIPVQGTPTLLINGQVLNPLPKSVDELVAALKAAMPAS